MVQNSVHQKIKNDLEKEICEEISEKNNQSSLLFKPKLIDLKIIPPFSGFQPSFKKILDKSAATNETLNLIISILRDFYQGSELNIIHYPVLNEQSSTWSVSGGIYNGSRSYLATFGKGSGLELSMASFYGELIERIQEGRLFSRNPYKNQMFLSHLAEDKIQNQNNTSILNINYEYLLRKRSVSPTLDDCPRIPTCEELFHYNTYLDLLSSSLNPAVKSINNKRIDDQVGIYKNRNQESGNHGNMSHDPKNHEENTIFLRNTLNHSTTGCASGNSYEEAFIQGFSEIIERYNSFLIMKNKIQLPTIDKSVLTPNIKYLVEQLEDQGIKIIIKDASLDLKIPVVALIFDMSKYNKIFKLYNSQKPKNPTQEQDPHHLLFLKFGAASNINIAVERAITEALQGIHSLIKRIFSNNEYVAKIDQFYLSFPQVENIFPKENYYLESFSADNYFPPEQLDFLLQNNGTPQYLNYSDNDLKNEVTYICELLEKNHFHLYMHDLNWLGFPTVKIFIPEMNCGYRIMYYFTTPAIEAFKEKLLTNFLSLTEKDIQILEDPNFLLQLTYRNTLNNFFQIDTTTLEETEVWEFFGKLAHAFGRQDLAKKYFNLCTKIEKPLETVSKTLIMNTQLNTNIEKKNQICGQKDLFNTEIMIELSKIIPNCHKQCLQCKFASECKYTVLKDFEAELMQKYPSHLIQVRREG